MRVKRRPSMQMFTLFIGTAAHRGNASAVGIKMLEDLLAPVFPSFTILPAAGVFRGQSEQTYLVKVTTTDVMELVEQVETIRRTLDQEGVGMEHAGRYQRVIKDTDAPTLLHQMFPRVRPEYLTTVFQTVRPAAGWPDRFAVITGCNPDGEPQSAALNQQCHAELAAYVSGRQVSFWEVNGCSPDLRHCEPGFGVATDLATALAVAQRFRQEAIFWIQEGLLSLWTADGTTDIPLGPWAARLR
jgi:hypothetical protein